MKNLKITRTQLYELVWSKPMTTIAKEYNISYTELRKKCIDMNIPLPQMGHWQKIQYGKSISITELSTVFTGDDIITFDLDDKKEIELNFSNHKKLHAETKSEPVILFKVPDRLTNPDKLIVAAKDNLMHVKRPYGLHNGLIFTSSGLIDIKVAPENILRSLRFMDALIKLLRSRNHEIIIERGTTYAVISGIKFTICLQEKLRTENIIDKYGWSNREYFPSGILTFRAWLHFRFHQKIWADGKIRIENQLKKILANLEFMAKREKDERIRHDEERKICLEKQKIEEEIRERNEKELKDFKNLLKQANRWHQTQVLRGYIKELGNKAIDRNELSNEFKTYINWALEKADWYDPLINKEDLLLVDADKLNFN